MNKKSQKREHIDYLIDVTEAVESIEKFIKGFNLKRFKEDEKTIFAVIRAFEVIGEAVKNISAKERNKHKEIPWKKMAGMRDKLMHEYFGVNVEVVWKTAKEDIPDLKSKISRISKELKKQRLL